MPVSLQGSDKICGAICHGTAPRLSLRALRRRRRDVMWYRNPIYRRGEWQKGSKVPRIRKIAFISQLPAINGLKYNLPLQEMKFANSNSR